MEELQEALRLLNFRWLPKHLNHIAENIVFKKRNVSFLAINALFRSKDYYITKSEPPFEDSFIITGFVDILPNDRLRTKAGELNAVFRIDAYKNIIVSTAYSTSDD